MSTKTISKIETRMIIGFDDETKAQLSAITDTFDAIKKSMAVNANDVTGGLLEVMRGGAANDDQPELKEMGQWVFEGQDEKWVSASVDEDGTGVLHNDPKERLEHDMGQWYGDREHKRLVDVVFDATNWTTSPIDRETVNDVYYLSDDALNDSVPHIDDVLAQPNWLSDSVPQITQDDLQLIFIKNLSNVLIQRMQTMDRFSDDDYAIGGGKLMAWDIVFEPLTSTFGLFTGKHEHQKIGSFLFFTNPSKTVVDWDMATAAFTKTRTITESEMKDFREVLEACYA
jgi:hypothetical protein